MGQGFIEELLANINNDQALDEGLNKLTEANKDAYQQAVENLRQNQSRHEVNHDSDSAGEPSRLDLLLKHLS